MPIHPANKPRYPLNWPAISRWVRFGRAGGRCECHGECGHNHGDRCAAQHGRPHPVTGSRVVLMTAHLDDIPENCDPSNLKGMCQRCHLNYDLKLHILHRKQRQRCQYTYDLLERVG